MGIVLVVFCILDWPLRAAVRDHLYAFERWSDNRVLYLNLAVRRVPRWLRHLEPDMVVFHTTFLSKRGSAAYWERMVERARPLKGVGAVRVALPQDEYLPPGRLCDFVEEFDVEHVFSVAPPSEWPVIYPSVDHDRVKLHRVLTGYLDPNVVARIQRLGGGERAIDVGYRAKDLPYWLGRHARVKADLAAEVARAAPKHGLTCDVSTRREDTLLGGDWWRFLLSCKATVGAEGGASVLDRDGSLRDCVERHLQAHPQASFEEVEEACFPGRDGEFGLVALSPRHLEACATRTLQVLVEGEYNGVLEAGRHYVPLRPDFSNLDDALDQVKDDDRRRQVVDAAYRDVVESGDYTYERLVREVEDAAMGEPRETRAAGRGAWARTASKAIDRLSWLEVIARLRLGPPVLWLLSRLRARGQTRGASPRAPSAPRTSGRR